MYRELEDMQSQGRFFKVGLVGGGFMGRGIVEVLENVPGMKVVALADIDIERAARCFENIPCTVRTDDSKGPVKDIAFPEERVITDDFRLIPGLEGIDMVIEATGKPAIGAETAFLSMVRGKHTGMLNVETDATVGPYLGMLAKRMGTVYTVCAGDEPAAVVELVDFARLCGCTVVAAGKGKNNPLDNHGTPRSLEKRAKSSGLNPKMLTEFVDGTKTMVEMCCAANSAGLDIDVRNMHGPSADVADLPKVFSTGEGGVLEKEGVVDYIIGDLAPGVFAVVRPKGPVADRTLRYLRVGEGPNYALVRPYHLTNLEVPLTVANACLHGRASMTPGKPRLEVITRAKKDLKKDDVIDGFGGECVYGGIERSATAEQEGLLPMGLCEGARVREDIARDEVIKKSSVEVVDSILLQFRKIQEAVFT